MRLAILFFFVTCAAQAQQTPDAQAEAAYELDLLERALLSFVTLDDRGHVANHCAHAPRGCAARIHRIAVAFTAAGHFYEVDPWLIAAIATRESGLNPDALGRSHGELGLLQLHPQGVAARYARQEAAHGVDWGTALVRGGVWLLATCLLREHGDVPRALARYHTGHTGSHAGEVYARLVLERRDRLLRVVTQ